MANLNKAIEYIRAKFNDDLSRGTAFEQLVKVFLENDPTQKQEFSEVWFYKDWAKIHPSYSQSDIGIDLVAKIKGSEGFCAIQCKFYKSDHSISKSDLDSFISASNTKDFKRLLLIDTSDQSLGRNAQSVFENLNQEYTRIQSSELENSPIEWMSFVNAGEIRFKPKKIIRDHQIQALEEVKKGLRIADRGKMIMACGTGKTFTSLKIAEQIAGVGKCVLYMVPSLSLMSQTLREWKNDSEKEFTAFSVCSDKKIGKRQNIDDSIEITIHDLAFPATTNPEKLSEQIKKTDSTKMTVVFSTYQSIEVISKAQQEFNIKEFDLIICDEAHRTTGENLIEEDESKFIQIHDNSFIKGKKRLYMTATPRIYGEKAKKKASEDDVLLTSMDDESIFGKVLFGRGFGWAVQNNLLTDYKVVVLAMEEEIVSNRTQNSLSSGSQLVLDDATKMVGCYKALAKVGFKESAQEEKPMKRALAFCQKIALSKTFSEEFTTVVNEYLENEDIPEEFKSDLNIQLFHVDGTFNSEQRNKKLEWLKEETQENTCRVLTNAKCLSEGVDVPALDAIMFLHPRKSQIDIIQSVGRVMRKAENKKIGYVIIPITISPGVSPEKALNDNKKYQVVWQILNALRAHDERLDSDINKISLGEDVSDRIEIINGFSNELEATTSVIEDIKSRRNKKEKDPKEKIIETGEGEDEQGNSDNEVKDIQMTLEISDLSQAIKAKIVEKCGTRDYWEKWAEDIAEIAKKHIIRINSVLIKENTPEREAFNQFLNEIRDDLNPSISETDAVEMLAQHIITRPVFESLFKGNQFIKNNAVSKAMEKILNLLNERYIDNESNTLKRFYSSVQQRSKDIVTANGRQTLIKDLYDRFFKYAFPLMSKKLGIVYTPIEVVDFMINSINDILQSQFNKRISDEGIHIIDPFTGTGTFITRLLQSKLIPKEKLFNKYKKEIHANEIVLLAYYVACINIETVFSELYKESEYHPFEGIVLTDTFQLYEQERDMIANLLPDNSNRRTRQKNTNIKLIMGNPPYSSGQNSANDNAENLTYANLNSRIEKTYSAGSKATSVISLYDSYIKAFRWASDRIEEEGIIGFVSGAGWIDGLAADGMRKSLAKEFSSIYIINLRGDIRKSMLTKNRDEGENIFGQNSMTPISITFLVKKETNIEENCKIYYSDIGRNLSKGEKLSLLNSWESIETLIKKNKFKICIPDENNDWINQGVSEFKKFISIGSKKNYENLNIFSEYSVALKTGRDAWCVNFSIEKLRNNMHEMINFYNSEMDRFLDNGIDLSNKNLLNTDKDKIKWSGNLYKDFSKGIRKEIKEDAIYDYLYRPFIKSNVYFDRDFNDRVSINKKVFPKNNTQNIGFAISGIGSRNGLSVLMSKKLCDLNLLDGGTQFFPLNIYEEREKEGLFKVMQYEDEFEIKNCLSKYSLDFIRGKYQSNSINKEDIFYYVYGILHSNEYRVKFENNLLKELPRIPLVNNLDDFLIFSKTGKRLGDIHINFEEAELFKVEIKLTNTEKLELNPQKYYRVEKMKFVDTSDKSKIKYNKDIIIESIPLEAYDYKVNGRSPVEWVMDKICITKNAITGKTNDANDYANEVKNNPSYPLELLQRVISVSVQSTQLIQSLPALRID